MLLSRIAPAELVLPSTTALAGAYAPTSLLLVKATLLILMALGISALMSRATAGARHLLWLVTIVTLLLMPAVAAWAPLRMEILPVTVQNVPSAPVAAAAAQNASFDASANDPSIQPVSGAVSSPASVADVAPATPTAAADAFADSLRTTLRDALRSLDPMLAFVILWAAVSVFLLARLAGASFVVRRMVSRADALDTADWQAPLMEVSDRIGLAEVPRLMASTESTMPFACGLVQPTIVLPADCSRWSLDRRYAVLLHEVAHIERRDIVGHALGRVACALYWFHPLVWSAAKRLRAESERACDDLALVSGARASDYAEHLLDIVTMTRKDTTPVIAMAMARRKEFEGRMLAILDPAIRHDRPNRKSAAALTVTIGVMALFVSAAAPAPRTAPRASTTAEVQPIPAPAPAVMGKQEQPPVRSRPVDEYERARLRELERQAVRERSRHRDGFSDAERALASELGIEAGRIARSAIDGALNGTINGTINGAINSAISGTIGSAISGNLANVVSRTTQRTVEDAVNRALTSGVDVVTVPRPLVIRDESLAQRLTTGSREPSSAQQDDDRPALLARVLRTDTSASLRRIAAWGLESYTDDATAADALANALRRDANVRVREMAAWSLGSGSSSRTSSVEALVAGLRDASPQVRATSAWALGNVGHSSATEALAGALSDTSASVRMRALWAIGNIEPSRVPQGVLAALRDKEPGVRQLATWVLFQSRDASAIPALDAAMRAESEKKLQTSYVRALAAMGERSVDAIRRLLDSDDPEVRAVAVRALAGGNATGPWPWPWPQPRPNP